jgi:hypothetical protein
MTTARIDEGELAGLRWLGVRGERTAVFRALGEAARDDVHATLEAVVAGPLQRRMRSDGGRAALDTAVDATRRRRPVQYAELVALAEGAGADLDLVLTANLRGDLGTEDGTGCSDLGLRGARSFLAHNEDGPTDTRLTLLTLAIDGDPAVAVEWYPGFLPSNTFVVTGHGLAWGIDHLTVTRPVPAAPGRHFVAREAQRCATLDELVVYLAANPSAGGFAYNAAELATGRVATVEVAAGRAGIVYAEPDTRPLLAHTNHVRLLDAEGTDTSGNTQDRARLLDALVLPDRPDAAWFLDVLGGACLPDGVRQQGPRGKTLCTAVVDVAAKEVAFKPADGAPATIAYDALLAGP